jgi:hypothetical protein
VPVSLARCEHVFDERVGSRSRDLWFAVTVGDELIGDCGVHSVDDCSRTCDLGTARDR